MILRHWKLSSGLIAASMLTLAVSAAAQIVNVFDCEAGDMNYHIEVDLAAYPKLLQIEKNMLQDDRVRKATPAAHLDAPPELENIHGSML